MNKKYLPFIIGAVVIVVLGGAYFAYTKIKGSFSSPTTTATKPKITENVNVITVDQRPYAQMAPSTDGHNITFRVISLKLPADTANYSVEYQTGSLLQGFDGTLSLATLPAEVETLMGTRSAGGATTYNTDIQGGDITTEFTGKGNDYALKADWGFLENTTKGNQVESRDVKFQMTADPLAKAKFIVVFNGYGYPDGLTGTPISDPYGLSADIPLTGQGTLQLKANETGATKIMGYDGSAWHAYDVKAGADGKTLTATVDMMEMYIAVK